MCGLSSSQQGVLLGTTANVTLGQAFTDEWGVGQVLPLNKKLTKLLQLGVIGYDQWQVTADSGTLASGCRLE
jgi:hypothetical protein